MNQRIPEAIRPPLHDYISLVNQQIPGLMKSFYLEGSIALGGFNEHFSDIDFVALLNRQLTGTEFETLGNIHKVIGKSYPRWKMSGSYLQSDALGSCNNLVQANICYEGRLRLEGHFDWNWVAGWILKNHGIAMIGPEPQSLPVTIDWERLIQGMRENLNSYWAGWTRRPAAFGEMLFDLGIQWSVLGVLRQVYSFRENAITTKTKAGEYALTCVPSRWHPLIREAIDIRSGRRSSVCRFRIVRANASTYQLRIVRTIEAVRFLNFIIETCNAGFNDTANKDMTAPPFLERFRHHTWEKNNE